MCLKHNMELVWSGWCSYCPSCYTEDTYYQSIVDQFVHNEKEKQILQDS